MSHRRPWVKVASAEGHAVWVLRRRRGYGIAVMQDGWHPDDEAGDVEEGHALYLDEVQACQLIAALKGEEIK